MPESQVIDQQTAGLNDNINKKDKKMIMKSFSRIIPLLLCTIYFFSPVNAIAWELNTHVWIAQQVLDDVLEPVVVSGQRGGGIWA